MLKGLKTYAVAGAFMAFGLAESFNWVSVLGENTGGAVAIVTSAAMMLLRHYTDSPAPTRRQ